MNVAPNLQKLEFVHCDFLTISLLNELNISILLGDKFISEPDDAKKIVELSEGLRNYGIKRGEYEDKDDASIVKSKSLSPTRRFALQEIHIRSSDFLGESCESHDVGTNGEDVGVASFNYQRERFYANFGIKLTLF